MAEAKATPKQLRYLRILADRTGTTFSAPKTRAEASRAIEAMRARARSSAYELSGDREAVAGRHGGGDGAAVRGEEVSGYGSSAHWRGREAS